MLCSYSLTCSVCKSEHFSKTDWLRHLTADEHQVLARKECLEEWNDKRLMECCLVVFSSFPMTGSGEGETGGDRILDYFSREVSTFVTDFVWWEDRDCIGFVQFESRSKVKDALSCSQDDSANLLIDNERVQVRWALDLLDLEWNAMLPGELNTSSSAAEHPIYPVTFSNSKSKLVTVGTPKNSKPCNQHAPSPPPSFVHEEDQSSNISSTNTKGADAKSLLANLVHQNHWNTPKYTVGRTTAPITSRSAFWCTLTMNGINYEAGGNTNEEAKQNVASVCLKAITSPSAFPTRAFDETRDSDDYGENDSSGKVRTRVGKKRPLEVELNVDQHQNGGDASKKLKIDGAVSPEKNKNSVGLLMELTQRRKLPQPEFFFSQQGPKSRPVFSCTVIVNQVEYKPDRNIPPAKTKKDAKINAAAFCLRLLTSKNPGAVTYPNDKYGADKQTSTTNENQTSASTAINKLPPSISSSLHSLQYQFWYIRNSIRIPDQEYQEKAVNVKDEVKALFFLNDPTAEVVMFRNWFLQLRNPISSDNDILLFYVYNTRTQPSLPSSFTLLPDTIVSQVFSRGKGQRDFTVIEAVDFGNDDPRFKEQLGWKIKYNPNNVCFHVLTYKRFFMEVQICRFLQYMCQFDPRCHPLLMLTYYWSLVNSSYPGENEPNGRTSHLNLSEPLTLQWLVVFFLCHRKYIPTPREIQERPHDTLIDRHTEVDVGFHDDPDFVEEWKSRKKSDDPSIPENDDQSSEDYIFNVLLLFQDFLIFCGKTLNTDNWILNTRDGELISIEKFLTSPPNSGNVESATYWSTKMTCADVSSLGSLQQNPAPVSDWEKQIQNENADEGTGSIPETKTSYRVNFREWKLYIVHPFIFKRKFSVSKDIKVLLQKMGSSGLQLKKFLNMRRSNGIKAAKRRFGTLENVFKLTD